MDQHLKINALHSNNSSQHKEFPGKQTFLCQCGKQYQSFAAIYLHFRTKHDIKLSTKPNEGRRKVLNRQDPRKIMYSLNNSDENLEAKKNEVYQCNTLNSPHSTYVCSPSSGTNELKKCIDSYLSTQLHAPKWIYRMLAQFLQIQWQNSESESIQKIPRYLNKFVMEYIPVYNRSFKVGSSTWRKLCGQLYKFCGWLHEKKYTDLILVYDDIGQK